MIVELTLHDGRRTGVPSDCALVIMDLEHVPLPDMPKAKTLLRYYSADGARHVQVRDSFRHVLSCFPMPFQGEGWAHLETMEGAPLCIAKKSVIGYEELPGEAQGFSCSFSIPTGPLTFAVRATLEEVRGLFATPADQPGVASE